MLRLASYDIVFQEIPGEVTLALNLSGCPNGCPGCHSPHLQEDTGEPLDERLLEGLLATYGSAVTCVCFMGGDNAPADVARLSGYVRCQLQGRLKTAWYSGREQLPATVDQRVFDYIKLGPYVEYLGALNKTTTNQRLYKIAGTERVDITSLFWENRKLK